MVYRIQDTDRIAVCSDFYSFSSVLKIHCHCHRGRKSDGDFMLARVVLGVGTGNLLDSTSHGHRIMCKTLDFGGHFLCSNLLMGKKCHLQRGREHPLS